MRVRAVATRRYDLLLLTYVAKACPIPEDPPVTMNYQYHGIQKPDSIKGNVTTHLAIQRLLEVNMNQAFERVNYILRVLREAVH